MQYRKSLPKEGERVGIILAGALSNSIMQRLLDGKRGQGGSANDEYNFLKNTMSLKPSNEIIRLFFHETFRTAKDLYEAKANLLRYMTLADLIPAAGNILMQHERPKAAWRDLWLFLTKQTISASHAYVLMLQLDPGRIARAGLFLHEIADAINDDGTYLAIPSPPHLAQLEIYPGKGTRIGENAAFEALDTKFDAFAAEFRLSGIRGVINVYAGQLDYESLIVEYPPSKLPFQVAEDVVIWQCLTNTIDKDGVFTLADMAEYEQVWRTGSTSQ